MDRRSMRTRKWLQEALISLLKDKPFEALTVQEITDKADTARMTFYRHFQDKDELLKSCTEQFLEQIKPLLQSPLLAKEAETGTISRQNLQKFYDYVASYHDYFKALLTGSVGASVRNQLRQFVTQLVMEALEGGGSLKTMSAPPEIVATYIAEGTIGLLIWWLENDAKHPTELLAKTVVELTEVGVFGLTRIDHLN